MGEGLKRAFAAARATQDPTKKRKWDVYGRVVATKYLGQFEADTKEEAEQLALERGDAAVHLCHACVKEADSAEIESAEAELIEE